MSVLKSTLQEAIMLLASHESAKTRLTKAWVDRLETLQLDDMPESIREQFKAMRDRLMARRPVNNEHPIEATIRKMSPMEASSCGQDIVQMYVSLVNLDTPVNLRLIESKDAASEELPEALPDFLTQH